MRTSCLHALERLSTGKFEEDVFKPGAVVCHMRGRLEIWEVSGRWWSWLLLWSIGPSRLEFYLFPKAIGNVNWHKNAETRLWSGATLWDRITPILCELHCPIHRDDPKTISSHMCLPNCSTQRHNRHPLGARHLHWWPLPCGMPTHEGPPFHFFRGSVKTGPFCVAFGRGWWLGTYSLVFQLWIRALMLGPYACNIHALPLGHKPISYHF